MSLISEVTEILSARLPDILRWSGSIARTLRKYNISLNNKATGYATTDALTLADITVQELIVGALRDFGPIIRQCRIEAEEANGPLDAFNQENELVIAIDPIDGTKQFRDHSGQGYAVMVHVRDLYQVYYSLCFMPEMGEQGSWVEVKPGRIVTGEDDPTQTARAVLDAMPSRQAPQTTSGGKIYMINFLKEDAEKAQLVNALGLEGVIPDLMPGSIYPLLASGDFAGSLIHTPNIYDYPVSLHIVREFGGDSVWVHSGEPVNFKTTWMDERAGMLRLPAIVATSYNRDILNDLVQVAKDWDQRRYRD
jgi:3'(2'), 5'-bisphosphate nucleotidase